MSSGYSERVIISVGGSLIVPNGGINTIFLSKFNLFIREQLALHKNRQFFLVIGGGATARHYRDAGRDVVGHELTRDDLDYLGIHATKLNAHLVRTIFRDVAHPYIIKHYEIIRKVTEPVVVAAGWKPGWSTDYCAILLCEDYDVRRVINLSNIDRVYDGDPRRNKNVKPYDRLTWDEFRKIVGEKWIPGMNAPFDPVAAKKAQELGVTVIVLNGNNLENLKKCLDGEPFVGTTIA
jgi:uridylate kinase